MPIKFLNDVAVDTSVLYVDTINDRVGIGTASPADLLHIGSVGGGSIRIETYETNAYAQMASADGNLSLRSDPSNAYSSSIIDFTIDNNERMRITSAGNVGIGTTSPDTKLHVDPTVKIGDRQGTDGSLILQSQQGPNITLTSSGNNLNISGATGSSNGNTISLLDNIKLFEFSPNIGGTIKIRRGNRGLMDTNFGGFVVEQQTTTNSNGRSTFLSTDTNGTILRSTSYGGTGTGADIQFQFGGGDNTSEPAPATKMIIKNSGNVGIGTTSPASKLQVDTGTDINAQIGLDSFGSFKLGDISNNYTGRGIYYDGTAGSEDLDILTNTFNIAGGSGEGIKVVSSTDVQLSSPTGVVITINGTSSNVGIGTTSPSQKFHVSGNARVTGAYYDSNNSPGTSNQVLVSTVTGTDWIDGSAIPGVPDGSGTAGKIVMWQDSDTLTDSKITQTAGGETNYVDIDFANVEDLTITGDSSFSTFTVNGFDAVNFTNIENNFNVGNNDLSIATGDGSMSLGTGTADSDTLTVGYTTTTFIGTGNFGIGTTSPGEKLTLQTQATGLGSEGVFIKNPFAGSTPIVNSKSPFLSLATSNSSGYTSTIYMGRNGTATGQESKIEWSNSNDGLSIYVAGQGSYREHVRFGNLSSSVARTYFNGTVGIGTTSPAYLLDVNEDDNVLAFRVTGGGGGAPIASFVRDVGATGSSVNINAQSNFPQIQFANTSNTFSIGGDTSGNFKISDNTAIGTNDRITINNTGNVGIGTTSPQEKLHVYNGSAYITPIAYAANQNDWVIRAGAYNNTSFDQGLKLKSNSGGVSYMAFETAHSGGETMVLRSGNVGIGTDSPGKLLELKGGDNEAVLRLFNDQANTWDIQNSTLGKLDFIRGSSNTYMRIDQSGNVGIGTTSPQEKLHVQNYATGESHQAMFKGGAVTIGDYSYISLNNGYSTEYNKEVRLAAVAELSTSNKTGFAILTSPDANGASGHERLRVTADGNVGIGTTSPSFQLELSTNSAGKPTSSAWTIVSDERVKTNIRTYETGLQELLQIKPKVFDYNGKAGFDTEAKNNIGVIAQEIKDIMPETVKKYNAKLNEEDKEDTELYNFDTHALTFALINSVKELNAKIENLEEKIQTLQNK